MAEWTGLEPATSGVTGQHSNRLNYHSAEPEMIQEAFLALQHFGKTFLQNACQLGLARWWVLRDRTPDPLRVKETLYR